LISFKEFAELHDITVDSLYVAKCSGTWLSEFMVGDMMDEKAYIESIKYNVDVINMSHTLYYPMVELFGSVNKLSAFLAKITDYSVPSWNVWFSKDAFSFATRNKPTNRREEFVLIAAMVCFLADRKGDINLKEWIL